VKIFDQSSLLTIGSITVSSMDLLAIGRSMEVPASFLMMSSWDPGGCGLIPEAFPFSCGPSDSLGVSDGVEDPGEAIGDRVTSTSFGLKKPANVFWPTEDPSEDVDKADLERFANVEGRGWERFREAVRESRFPSVIDAEPFSGESVDPKVVCKTVDLATRVVGMLAGTPASSTDSDGMLTGLRVNMSLMLLRLSTLNSGSKRPEAGNAHSFEYSC
jgi:hypothetical protein